jgi:hypothetical protein
MLASGATGFYDSAGNASSKLNDGHIVTTAQAQRQADRHRWPGGEDVSSANDHAGQPNHASVTAQSQPNHASCCKPPPTTTTPRATATGR